MEFPTLGSNCSEITCNKLDFLPVKCDGCQKLFCVNHMTYTSHNCPTPRRVDNQVPVCPLCNKPVPSSRGETPDIAVNAHIERDCQSDPAKNRRKVFTRCSAKNCKNKEVVPIICDKCSFSYCVFHRHPTDHKCNEKSKFVNHMNYTSHNRPTPKRVDNQVPECPLCNKPVPSNRGETPDIAVNAHIERDCQLNPAKNRRKTEDEALAYAIAISSMPDTSEGDNNYHRNRPNTANNNCNIS